MVSKQQMIVMLGMICLMFTHNVQACETGCPLDSDCSTDWTLCKTEYCCGKVMKDLPIYRCVTTV